MGECLVESVKVNLPFGDPYLQTRRMIDRQMDQDLMNSLGMHGRLELKTASFPNAQTVPGKEGLCYLLYTIPIVG